MNFVNFKFVFNYLQKHGAWTHTILCLHFSHRNIQANHFDSTRLKAGRTEVCKTLFCCQRRDEIIEIRFRPFFLLSETVELQHKTGTTVDELQTFTLSHRKSFTCLLEKHVDVLCWCQGSFILFVFNYLVHCVLALVTH